MLPLLLAAAAASAAPTLTRYGSVALDPAGKRIASVESEQAKGAPSAGHGIVVIRDTTGKILDRRDPCATCSYGGLAWSPDGKSLALVASGGGAATLYALEGAVSRKVAQVKGLAASPRWSPDGKSIALLVTQDATKETGATQPGVRQVGVIGEKEDSKRIALVAASGGDLAFVSPEGTFVYEYDWTPDGRGFVGTAAEGNGDNQWWVATLRAFPIGGGMRTIASPKLQMNFPRVSPDGKSVTFIAGLMSDFGAVGGDIYQVAIDGGVPTNITPGFKGSFTSLQWRGARMIATAIVGGSSGVVTLDPGGRITGQTQRDESCGASDGQIALDAKGAMGAAACESFVDAPAIGYGSLALRRKITHENDALQSGLSPQNLTWRSGGREVQGWLLAPVGQMTVPPAKRPGKTMANSAQKEADQKKLYAAYQKMVAAGPPKNQPKQPMVTIIHGGPSAATTPRFPWGDLVASLSAKGYWLFQPNPRGSYGQGASFVSANVKDFGGGDLDDINAGIDAAIKAAPIDPEKLGVYGHSYGGFMTMWTVTHSTRFKAAVAGAGIADWMAYYGQNGIDQWMVPFFGTTVYDDPRVYDRLSPIRYIKAAKTPTLLYVGERDVETPAAQSLEFWHGLRAMNVPTQLVIYQDEGHGLRDPAHLTDRETRMIGWFDQYLGVTRRRIASTPL